MLESQSFSCNLNLLMFYLPGNRVDSFFEYFLCQKVLLMLTAEEL